MSNLFNKLSAVASRQNWTDEECEKLYTNPKLFDYTEVLGTAKETWTKWSSFLERKKLKEDFDSGPLNCWYWISWELHSRRSLGALYLSEPVKKRAREFKVFFEARQARQDREYKLKALQEEKERLKRLETEALLKVDKRDFCRVAYKELYTRQDLALFAADKKKWEDCKFTYEETPPDTTQAKVELVEVFDDETKPDRKLVDFRIECTNNAPSLSAEDFQALNAGTKKLKDCQLIIKAFPTPVLTVNEAVKKKVIEAYNAGAQWILIKPPKDLYTRSDAEKMEALMQQRLAMTKEFLRRDRTTCGIISKPKSRPLPPPNPPVKDELPDDLDDEAFPEDTEEDE